MDATTTQEEEMDTKDATKVSTMPEPELTNMLRQSAERREAERAAARARGAAAVRASVERDTEGRL